MDINTIITGTVGVGMAIGGMFLGTWLLPIIKIKLYGN